MNVFRPRIRLSRQVRAEDYCMTSPTIRVGLAMSRCIRNDQQELWHETYSINAVHNVVSSYLGPCLLDPRTRARVQLAIRYFQEHRPYLRGALETESAFRTRTLNTHSPSPNRPESGFPQSVNVNKLSTSNESQASENARCYHSKGNTNGISRTYWSKTAKTYTTTKEIPHRASESPYDVPESAIL